MNWRVLIGFIMSQVRRLSPKIKYQINKITRVLLSNIEDKPKGKNFVMMVGFTHAGKHTFIEQHPQLKHWSRVDTDLIHNLLNKNFHFLRDDNTVKGPAYWQRQDLTRIVSKKILEQLFKKGLSVINDSCNLKKDERAKRLTLAKKFGYRTVIIWVFCSEEELLNRLQKADKNNEHQNLKPVWVDLYLKVQKERFHPPEHSEANQLIIYNSGKDQPQEILI